MELSKQPTINLDGQVPRLSDYIRCKCVNSKSVGPVQSDCGINSSRPGQR